MLEGKRLALAKELAFHGNRFYPTAQGLQPGDSGDPLLHAGSPIAAAAVHLATLRYGPAISRTGPLSRLLAPGNRGSNPFDPRSAQPAYRAERMARCRWRGHDPV